jgi:hypothetical protein
VIDLSTAEARAVLMGNIIDDGGRTRHGQTLGQGRRGGASARNISGVGNWIAPGFASKLKQTGLQETDNTVAGQSRQLYVDAHRHDYRLREAWEGIVRAGRSPHTLTLPSTPGGQQVAPPLSWQYLHPLGKEPRAALDQATLGAKEFTKPTEGQIRRATGAAQ